MKRLLVVGLVLAAGTLSACSASPEQTGSPAVFQRIASMTDCADLQSEFDTAERNGDAARARSRLDLAKASTSYMRSADDRMRESREPVSRW